MTQNKAGLRSRIVALWSTAVEHPLGRLVDQIRIEIDKVLTSLFLGNRVGRWLYNHTCPNDWTMFRLYVSSAPMVLILFHRRWLAVIVWFVIWTTDIIDGWLAKTKQLESDDGAKRETTVDSIFMLQTFVGIWLVYADVRSILICAAALEIVRLLGGLALRKRGYSGQPNRSGRVKTWAYAIGAGLRLVAPAKLAIVIIGLGIGLSIYSMLIHLRSFRQERRATQPRH